MTRSPASPTPSLAALERELKKHSDKTKAKFYPRYFKSGKGEYGEGDVFIGVTVPHMRAAAKQFRELSLSNIEKLLHSPIHEHRYTALIILDLKYSKGSETEKQRVIDLYLKNLDHVNNWDLVDTSAPYILGPHLFQKKRDVLFQLADSGHLWRERIALLTTQYFIRRDDFGTTVKLAQKLLHHPHDLIHKAVGWMLREIGDRDLAVEEKFLKKHYRTMPRTALRYAIEKFPPAKREAYLKGKI